MFRKIRILKSNKLLTLLEPKINVIRLGNQSLYGVEVDYVKLSPLLRGQLESPASDSSSSKCGTVRHYIVIVTVPYSGLSHTCISVPLSFMM